MFAWAICTSLWTATMRSLRTFAIISFIKFAVLLESNKACKWCCFIVMLATATFRQCGKLEGILHRNEIVGMHALEYEDCFFDWQTVQKWPLLTQWTHEYFWLGILFWIFSCGNNIHSTSIFATGDRSGYISHDRAITFRILDSRIGVWVSLSYFQHQCQVERFLRWQFTLS